MSRPILSRPRTRVYDCNYDKGESYYKPMMDHLDRKYSARPLFPESRGSFADEIAARRSDIGSRNLSGSRNSTSNSDLDYESPRPKKQVSHSFYGRTEDNDYDNEDTVYDIWGQRTNRLKLRNDFSNEIASATQRFKDQAANLSQNTDHSNELKHSVQQQFHNIEEKVLKNFKYTRDDNNFIPFQRYSDNMSESKKEHISPTKWSKLLTPDSDTCSNATIRAQKTKARLEDLENEIEELAERQAQRERRAVALKAFVSENTSSSGSRNLDGSNVEIERFFFDEYNPRISSEGDTDNNFVIMQRRLKDRAAESFEEELAELRRKRRDLEDRLFDMIDVDAEIKQAENTLQNANSIFQKHATKFNNKEESETEPVNLIERLEKVRKLKEMSATLESSNEIFMRKKNPLFKWSKFAELKSISPEYMNNMSRINVAEEASNLKKSEGTTSEKRRTKKQSVHRHRKQQNN